MPEWVISNLSSIITGVFTLLGTLLGIWWERQFQIKKRRESLFKSLYEEIQLNYSMAKRFKEKYKTPGWTVFEVGILYTLAYQNIRTTGELSILSRNTLSIFEETYEMIYVHNRQVTTIVSEANIFLRDAGVEERLGKIEVILVQLKEELPKQLKLLK